MKTRLQFLWLSVLLALIALGGLTWLQLGLLRDSTELRQQILDGRLRAIVFDVVRDLETMEVTATMPMDSLQQLIHWQRDTSIRGDSDRLEVFLLTDSLGGQYQKQIVRGTNDSNISYQFETEIYSNSDSLGTASGREKQSAKSSNLIYRAVIGHDSSSSSGHRVALSFPGQLHKQLFAAADSTSDTGVPVQSIFISQVIHRLSTMAPRSLKERVSRAQLGSLFKKHLNMAGIELSPEFAVFDSAACIFTTNDSVEFNRSGSISAPLFPFDLGGEAGMLRVHFPGQESYLWQDRWTTMVGSGIFMSMLAATVVLGLVVIRRQDRVRQRTQEFIANLTHEFTTPVSTIALAVEALSKDAGVAGNERSHRMIEMIGSENRRMRAQVQKILQLAQLEEGNIELSKERIELNELIRSIAASYQLTIEQRQGTMSMRLTDDQLLVRGDRTHLGNLISNLIDNAIKYSAHAPILTITSKREAGSAEFSVADQGIGIPLADQGTVFQKFVRGSTGNIHDVKGFGIGLSYVRAVVEAHGGSVALESKPGAGTTITIAFPITDRSPESD